jgi:hypothetical protein
MIRPSLKKAIESVLDSHVFLGRSDFLITEHQNKENEDCLVVAYRGDRKLCFLLTIQMPVFNLTMNPGREAFQETRSVSERSAVIEELRAWQQRVHEDVGVFPWDRQFAAHIRRISRMEACLGLGSKDIEDTSSFPAELFQWEVMLDEFISASQAMHHSVLVWSLRTRLNEIKTLEEIVTDSFELRRELDEMRRSIISHIEDAIVLQEKLEARQVCLVEREAFLPMGRLIESDSMKLDQIRDRIPLSGKPASLIEDANALKKRLTGTKRYCDDEHIKTYKTHLSNAHRLREQFESRNDLAEVKQTLDQMRKEISLLSSRFVMEREESTRMIRSTFQETLFKDDSGPALKYLEESLQKLETSARMSLDDLMNPLYLAEKDRVIRERILISLIRKKQILVAAVRLLKDDQVAHQRFLTMFLPGAPTDTP